MSRYFDHKTRFNLFRLDRFKKRARFNPNRENVGGGGAPIPVQIGTIIDDDFDTLLNLDDYVIEKDGSTSIVLDGGFLKISGTPDTLLPVDNVIYNKYLTGLVNWEFSYDFIVKSYGPANEGIAPGFISDSTHSTLRRDLYYWFRNTGSGATGDVYQQINTLTPTEFIGAGITPVIDDTFRFTFTKVENNYTVKIENISDPSESEANITYTFEDTDGTLNNSSSNLGIFHVGGECWIKNFKVSSTSLTNVEVGIFGDSMTQGYCSDVLADRWSDQLQVLRPALTYTISAGQNDRPDTLNKKGVEMSIINATTAIIWIGTNQIIQSGAASAQASYAAMYATLQAQGYTDFIHLEALPRDSDNQINVFNAWLSSTYGVSDIVVLLNDEFNDGTDNMKVIYDCGDTVHMNLLGQTYVAGETDSALTALAA